jgi:rSAM/selenodomain-associated transferase 2
VPSIAVVVPIRNEEREAPRLAERLQSVAGRCELAVVDGASHDGCAETLQRLAPGAALYVSPPGRARQMNHGARSTRAPILLFLHADTTLPDGGLDQVERAVADGAGFGCFPVQIDSPDPRLKLAASLINLRSRLICSATGDQAIFVRRDLFDQVGGFPEIELCEDLGLMHRLCGRAPFRLLAEPVLTSARRWEQLGVARTIALMWSIRVAWHLGVAPSLLARLYTQVR